MERMVRPPQRFVFSLDIRSPPFSVSRTCQSKPPGERADEEVLVPVLVSVVVAVSEEGEVDSVEVLWLRSWSSWVRLEVEEVWSWSWARSSWVWLEVVEVLVSGESEDLCWSVWEVVPLACPLPGTYLPQSNGPELLPELLLLLSGLDVEVEVDPVVPWWDEKQVASG